WFLPAAICLAGILHVAIVVRSPLIAPDGIGFIQYARELGDNGWKVIRESAQHPGYPLLIRATHAVTCRSHSANAGWEFAARLACGLSGLVCIPLIWLLVRQTVDVRAANVAAVVVAVLPAVRQNAADALSDSTHLMLYLTAVWLVCRSATDRRWWSLLLAGAA